MGPFYAYSRSQTTIKEGVSRLRKPDGTLTESNQESSEVLNQALQEVFVIEDPGPLPETNSIFQGKPLQEIEFSVEEVKECIQKLRVNSANGPDGVHPKVLREISAQQIDRAVKKIWCDMFSKMA